MILDVDVLIQFFKKYSECFEKQEVGEQEAAPASGGGTKVPKWADSYTITRGKANRLGAAGEKWNTDIKRGSANQIW